MTHVRIFNLAVCLFILGSVSASAQTPPPKDENIMLNDRGLVNMDFVNTEIAEIAKSMGELTQRNFIIDDKVRGKITIISPKAVTVDEAYHAFISALEVKNFTVIRVNKMHKIVPIKDTKKLPIGVDTLNPTGGGDAFVTRLIPIKFTKASSLQKSLRNLVSRNGDLFAYDPTNTLIITDSVANIRRLLLIIQKLDQQGFEESIHVIKLKYAPAADTAEKIKTLFGLESSGKSKPAKGGEDSFEEAQYISKIMPDERTNSLIVAANEDGARIIREFVQQIDQSLEDQISMGKIHVHYLQYADAVELAATLSGVSAEVNKQAAAQTGKNKARAPAATTPVNTDIQIVSDEHTNSLVITAAPSDYESLVPVINKLDIRRPQAFVEAMILEVDIDKASELGVAANGGHLFGNNDKNAVFGATTFGSASSIALPVSSAQGLLLGLQGEAISIPIGGGESLNVPVFGGVFKALQTDGTINVLSTPTILTRDNMEAEIIVGQVVPFITTSGRDINNQPINQIQRENVALTLRVTPQINASNELTLDIFQEIQDLVPGPNIEIFGPTTSTRSAKTTVLVKDGQTVSIGGLISDRISVSNSKVPILGDAPLIGWLFRNRSKTKKRLSLMMFLTPHIIRTPDDLEDMTVRKNIERRQFMEKNQIKDHPAMKNYGMNRNFHANPKEDIVPANSPSAGFLEETVQEDAAKESKKP